MDWLAFLGVLSEIEVSLCFEGFVNFLSAGALFPRCSPFESWIASPYPVLLRLCLKRTALLAATGNNKEVQVTFDAGIQLSLTLPNDKSPGVISFDPPIHSSSVKLEVKSVYSTGENGFAAIRLWASRKLRLFISSNTVGDRTLLSEPTYCIPGFTESNRWKRNLHINFMRGLFVP